MHGGVAPVAAVGRDRSVRQPDLLPPRCVGPPASAGRRLQVRIPPVIVLAPPTIASSVTPPARFAGRIRRLAVLQTLPPFRVEVQHPAPANVPCPNGDGHHGSPPMPEDDGSAHRPGSASQDGAVWPHQAPRKEIAIPVMQPRPGIQTPNRKSAFRESRHDVGAADQQFSLWDFYCGLGAPSGFAGAVLRCSGGIGRGDAGDEGGDEVGP